MLDQRLENQYDIIHQGQELLKCIEQANSNLEKQLEEFQFETVYVDFAPNYRTQFDKLISVSSRQDNELSNLLHTKKNILFQKPFTQSELSLARQSIDVFHEKLDRKASDKDNHDFKLIDGEVNQRLSIGGDLLDSPFQKNKYKNYQSNGYSNHNENGKSINNGNSSIQNNQHHQRNISHNYLNGSASQQNSAQNHLLQSNNSQFLVSQRKHTPSIFNNDLFDDNLLLNNDDINEQFNDSVLMMTKQSSKFNSPAFFNKVNVEEFMVTNSLGKSSLSEPQLLEGIEQELFGKNIELPNNIDVQIKYNNDHDNHHHQQNNNEASESNSLRISNQDDQIFNKIQIEGLQKDKNLVQDKVSKQKNLISHLNDKFVSILSELQKDIIEQADFTYADMGDEGIQGLCESLNNNKHLKSLKLQRNKISDKGACQLVDNIFDNESNIATLFLQDNMISDKFLDYLVQKFQKKSVQMKKIEHIYLKNNLLNVNKQQKVLEELKKMQITIYL